MIPVEEDEGDLFLASALAALGSSSGDEALAALGWGDFLGDVGSDQDARRAVFGFFRAQGRQLGSSGALGRLMAEPYRALLDDDVPTVAAVEYNSPRRGRLYFLAGAPAAARILVHRTGRGVSILEPGAAALRLIRRPDGAELQQIETDADGLAEAIPEARAAGAGRSSIALGRVALAHELLGAAETALRLAVRYAQDRHQFERPIGSFQAVRHLLAGARVDCAAIEALADQAIDLYPHLPPGHDAILKAVAGRNGRRTCEKTLQVMGGIGFTAEHDHHRYYSRVLALDGLLGSSAHLAAELAAELRATAGGRPDLNLPSPAGR